MLLAWFCGRFYGRGWYAEPLLRHTNRPPDRSSFTYPFVKIGNELLDRRRWGGTDFHFDGYERNGRIEGGLSAGEYFYIVT